jgi:hypothetical protein
MIYSKNLKKTKALLEKAKKKGLSGMMLFTIEDYIKKAEYMRKIANNKEKQKLYLNLGIGSWFHSRYKKATMNLFVADRFTRAYLIDNDGEI